MYYSPTYFELQEFLPKEFYEKWYPIVRNLLWQQFDRRLLITVDNLRRRYGKIIMNDWLWRKDDPTANQWRGLRTHKSPYGSALSQHRFGRAADLIVWKVLAEEVREDIKADPYHEDFKYITGIEEKVEWIHIDVRNWDKKNDGLYLFGP